MGYYTSHYLKVIDGDEMLIQALRKECDGAEYALDDDGESRESCKWYDHEKDIKSFSKKHPETLFELEGQGEDSGDMWKKYFKNGKMQNCRAKITYEPFQENLLN